MWGKPNTDIKPKNPKTNPKQETVLEWEVVKGKDFDPKTIDQVEFTFWQRVKITSWFYKWHYWKAMDRKTKFTLLWAVITYQVELDTRDYIECFANEISPL